MPTSEICAAKYQIPFSSHKEPFLRKGKFRLQAFENAEYWIRASVSAGALKFADPAVRLLDRGIIELNSKPIKVKAGRTNTLIKIIIPLPEGLSAPIQ